MLVVGLQNMLYKLESKCLKSKETESKQELITKHKTTILCRKVAVNIKN